MAVNKNIAVTVDAVIFKIVDQKRTHLLLIQRGKEPYKGKWAFPGGFLEEDEDLETAAARELKEETGFSVNPNRFIQVGAFGKTDRDPRGRTISVAYMTEVDKINQVVKGADDAGNAAWFPLSALPTLAFDHKTILARALKK